MSDDSAIEGEHVGVLLDIGRVRVQLEREAQQAGHQWYGYGFRDGGSNNPAMSHAAARSIINADPMAWYNLVAAQLMLSAVAETDEGLIEGLTHMSAITIAWIEDVKLRAAQ
jgi:hypothetical protein